MRINWAKLRKNIPHRIKINKIDFEVLWVENFKDLNTRGEMRLDAKQIIILKGLSNRETVETFIHEVWHAQSDSRQLGITESQVIGLELGTAEWIKLILEMNGAK